ncbi:hypothetical protein ACFFQW_11090 [Umezawaea endophytica]|uniref:Uncharacterized protein n=1 Tax=Umezawaea endophytica TaxID=1654476 RepID=A0A9X2VL56_9PSEU|nr:hypothetical protein [Umezawaea endophytica]MCS7478057.1 hypothetical protein [Umezawaea endophytica]
MLKPRLTDELRVFASFSGPPGHGSGAANRYPRFSAAVPFSWTRSGRASPLMSSRSNAVSDSPPPVLPPMPRLGISPPDWAVVAFASAGGALWPRPLAMVLAGVPALADTVKALESVSRTSPTPRVPRVRPRPPVMSEYWIPAEPTTSGKLSPLRSRKSTWPALRPLATLAPAPIGTPGRDAPNVVEIWVDSATLGTPVAPAKSASRATSIRSVPSRELVAPEPVTQVLPSSLPQRPSAGWGASTTAFGRVTRPSNPGTSSSRGAPGIRSR